VERNKTSNLLSAWNFLLRFGFHLLYNQLAWTYDWVSRIVSLGQWQEWQRAALPYLKGAEILELAHGPGHMLVELNGAGYQVYGIDISRNMGRLARGRLHKLGFPIALIRGDARCLPFRSETYDSILSTFPTEFIFEQRTLDSLVRVLKPGGRVVIVPEARLVNGGLIRRLIEWLFKITGQRVESDSNSWLAQRWIEVEKRILAAGFKVSLERIDLEDSTVTIVLAVK
jgi:ubiquinone/menaquinone biosynthesis C-methylase UbiE